MSINGFAKSDDLEKYWSTDHLSSASDRLNIVSTQRKRVGVIVDSYPFPDQVLLFGEFEYQLEGRRGFSPTADGKYLYRPASGLFILYVRQNSTDEMNVIGEINSAVGQSVDIREIRSIGREDILEFLKNSHQINEVVIRGPEGTATLEDAMRDEADDDERIIDTDLLDDHLIVSARASFQPPGESQPVVVRYNKGKFSISSNPPDDSSYLLTDEAEYVVQLLERDVFENQIN